jgi:NAD(P)-dependent dehydrogenase (short-subunit alcohol dehydrogenase family)
MRLQDQVAIVTGGGRGIGRRIATRFAAEGATVVIAEIDADAGAETCRMIQTSGHQALSVPTDVSSPEMVQHLVEVTTAEFGGIDVLVNNAAATGHRGGFFDVDLQTWNRITNINHTGLFITCQAVARAMVERGGSIINMASVGGIAPQPNNFAYCATKGSNLTLTQCMATELAHCNIRVNAIAPGPIDAELSPDSEPDHEPMALMGRKGRPEEIAGVAVFLASEDANYMTGQVLVADGGTLVNGYNIYQKPHPT